MQRTGYHLNICVAVQLATILTGYHLVAMQLATINICVTMQLATIITSVSPCNWLPS